MLELLALHGLPLLLCSQQAVAQPLPARLHDAGVYHLATGTWSSAETTASFGPKVLYNNWTPSQYFGSSGSAIDLVWTDEGRIPSTSGHPNATADRYVVDGFQLSYCSSSVGSAQPVGLLFYDCYAPCTDPTLLTPLTSVHLNLPGGGSATACWLVTIDLSGTSREFVLTGDCDGIFQGSSAADSFGWTLLMASQGSSNFGPLLAGDPNNYPYGDGTYYQNPGAWGTGLDTKDQFWLSDGSGTVANGCYWFGSGPFQSFALQLFGEVDSFTAQSYCQANSNSTGAPAELSGYGSNSVSAADMTLVASSVPNEAGVFFHGGTSLQLPFGNGFRCVGQDIRRGAPVLAHGGRALYRYDESDGQHALASFVGGTRYFQYWYQDSQGGGAAFNCTQGLQLLVQP